MQTGQKGQTVLEFYLLFSFCVAKSLSRSSIQWDRSDRRSVAVDVEKVMAGLSPEEKKTEKA